MHTLRRLASQLDASCDWWVNGMDSLTIWEEQPIKTVDLDDFQLFASVSQKLLQKFRSASKESDLELACIRWNNIGVW